MAADGAWIAMGRGIIDFPRLTAGLRQSGYNGWIMVEDESPDGEADPDAVTRANGRYIRESCG